MIGRWEVPQWSRRLCLRGHCRRAAGVVAVAAAAERAARAAEAAAAERAARAEVEWQVRHLEAALWALGPAGVGA